MAELALDLGTKMGFCIRTGYATFDCGVVNLGKKAKTKFDKYNNLDKWLVNTYNLLKGENNPIDKIYYEKVDFSYHTYSAQAHGGFVSIIQLFCKKNNIECEGFSVSEIKKKLTGRGNASKMGMVYYAEKYVNGIITNDNTADAIGVMFTARGGKR
jgi:crossover junction endodeoxyribonuclease RuvC